MVCDGVVVMRISVAVAGVVAVVCSGGGGDSDISGGGRVGVVAVVVATYGCGMGEKPKGGNKWVGG